MSLDFVSYGPMDAADTKSYDIAALRAAGIHNDTDMATDPQQGHWPSSP